MHARDHAGRFFTRLGPDEAVAVVRSQTGWIGAWGLDEVVVASGPPALARLDTLTPGWWAAILTFELGDAVERVERRVDARPALPGLVLARFAHHVDLDRDPFAEHASGPPAPAAHPTSSLDRGAYEAAVRDALEHIGAGDFYQVNLTRRLEWPHALDPVALFRALNRPAPAPHAMLLRLPAGALAGGPLAVVSASPERFLAWDGPAVETRPIKGTAADAATLARSAKDRAENVMIVDLARNDLGRVCEPGSITVPELCAVEAHPGLFHLVSTVRGRRRDGTSLRDLVAATFPPASVTGAPKPRVLQAIADAEPGPRGVYCGAIGWIDTEHDRGDLAVAIRTFTITEATTSFGTGAGIVADSDPGREWEETELKADRFVTAVGVRPDTAVSA